VNDFLKRTWLQINLDAIRGNTDAVRGILSPGTDIMAIVKADAYGHGVLHTVREMSGAGVGWFAVSNLEEALQVRAAGIEKPVLILGYTPAIYAEQLALGNISQTVFERSYAHALAEHAQRAGIKVKIHIKVDTGMTRLGFIYHNAGENAGVPEEIARVCALPGLDPEGIFTHFARADSPEGECFTRLQFDLFLDMTEQLRRRGVQFAYRHCCNSAATVNYPEMHMDLVRAGIVLYGLSTDASVVGRLGLRAAMELKTVISMVKSVKAGTPVSYGGTFITPKDMRLATVPVGYADGYPRLLSDKAHMLVCGRRAKVTGRVCMDQTMLDVTDIPGVEEGMTVTVFGRDGGDEITADTLAGMIYSLNYEIVCGINKRVPRVFMRGGEIERVTGYMDAL
jgi:alanine racemase